MGQKCTLEETVVRIWEKNNYNKLFTTVNSDVKVVVLKVINEKQASGWCVVYKNNAVDNGAQFFKPIADFIKEFTLIKEENEKA